MPEETSDNITFRPAEEKDIHACANAFIFLLQEIEHFPDCQLTLSEYNVRLFSILVLDSIKRFGIAPIIAEINGEAIGFHLTIKILGFETKLNQVNAIGSYVLPNYRHRGISTKMANFAFEYLKSKGVQILYASPPFKERESSPKLYVDLGVEEIKMICKRL